MNYAVLVLEQPWWTISDDPGQTSVRHFLDGLSRLQGVPIFHATFFDSRSFDLALQHLLDARKLEDVERLIVYVASHGAGARIGNGNAPSMNLSTVFDRIQAHGKNKVTGLILDSCEVGGQYETIQAGMKRARISWVVGYNASVDWLTSMLINMHLLAVMTCLTHSDLKRRNAMIEGVQEAFGVFNPFLPVASGDADGSDTHPPSDEDHDDDLPLLSEALTVVVRLPNKAPEILEAHEIWPDLADQNDGD